MIKKILLAILAIILLRGENAMASVLDAKQQAIAAAAAYAASGNQEGLKQVLKQGLDNGVSVNEFKEILVQAYAYCGFPRSLNALNTLMQLEEERGNKDATGKEPSALPQGSSLDFGTANQTKLIGAPVSGKLFEFAPAIDEFLKAHLFGDIFARDNVDWKTRELATVAMLAARNGVDSQLESHINIAKHNGLTDEEIAEVKEIASKAVVDNVVFGVGAENVAFNKYFTGISYLQPINKEGVGMFNVTFEPKARNNWHIHHKGGQILLVTAGRGWYQEWGKEASELKAGDSVYIAPETKHWHGAAKDSWFNHIAVEIPADGASNEWLEPVSDEEYNKLK